MIRMAPLLIALVLAGCQLYASGGTLVSDGRTTTVRTSETEIGTETGTRTRNTNTVIQRE
jgi:hypothetical protein